MSAAPIEIDEDAEPINLSVETDDGAIALTVGDMLIVLDPEMSVRIGMALCAAGFAHGVVAARVLH